MKEYLFGCIILSLIAAILTEGVPKSLESSAKSAIGVGLIVFASIPLGTMITNALNHPFPDYSLPGESENGFHETSEKAYSEGVRELLAERYSCNKSDFDINIDGFDSETLSADIIHVTLSGEAVLLDYRELSEYIKSALKVVKCDVQVEFS